jgi:hypothetical protein
MAFNEKYESIKWYDEILELGTCDKATAATAA